MDSRNAPSWNPSELSPDQVRAGARGLVGTNLEGTSLYAPNGSTLMSGAGILVTGAAGVGNTLTAEFPMGVGTVKWQRLTAGSWGDIAGATSMTYVQTSEDAGKSVRPIATSYAPFGGSVSVPDAPAEIVGGIAVGSAGAAGTMYDGFTLRWGDDFNTLDILGPANPRGKYWTTRIGGTGARGNDTLLGTQYDTDPLMTGHADSNRGVPVSYSNMNVSGSVLNLQARKATAGEQTHMQSLRNEVSAQISTVGEVLFYPGTGAAGEVIVESRMGWSASNPAGWHATFWTYSAVPGAGDEKDEFDFESNRDTVHLQRNVKTAGVNTPANYGNFAIDGGMHLVAFKLSQSSAAYYKNGAQLAAPAVNANSKAVPQFVFLTSHVYNGTFQGDTYNKSSWNADADGATLSIDYLRVWSRSALNHYKPLASLTDQNVAYGGSITITLPSKIVLWGNAGVTEAVQAVYNEENEPGAAHDSVYGQFPPGVSYNAGTRELTVNIMSGKAGRINFLVIPYDAAGSTCKPLRFAVNVGPKVLVTSYALTTGAAMNVDLYATCDCGVLTTNGTGKAKTISVSGLSGTGLSYSDATGMLTGTYTGTGATMAVTVTNSVGQSVTTDVAISAASAYAYEALAAAGNGWFDASDASSVTLSGSSVTALANKVAGNGNLSGGGAARTYNLATKNGRNTISFARNTSDPARLSAAGPTENISLTFSGSGNSYVVIFAFTPTDTNTGFPWSASKSVSGTVAQQIGMVRRSGSASDIRRSPDSTGADTPTAFTDAAGVPSGQATIVAVRFTGTTTTTWCNSTTPFLSENPTNTAAFDDNLVFRIGAIMAANSSLQATACAMDFYECVVGNSSSWTDAEIQQAITDMATKWGITLS